MPHRCVAEPVPQDATAEPGDDQCRRYDAVEESMAEVSNEEQPAARGDRQRPTISDVAALTGLSKATVSRALNDRQRVSAATRARVLATLEEIGYIRSHAAASLSTGRTGLLGLVVGANRNPTVLSAMHGALSAAGGPRVVVYVSETDEGHDTIYRRLLHQPGSRWRRAPLPANCRRADRPLARSASACQSCWSSHRLPSAV